MLQLLKLLPRLPGRNSLSLHTLAMANRLTQALAFQKFVESRMELLACYGRTGASFGDERYEKLLDDSEAAIFNQLTRISGLTCGETKKMIEHLSRCDLLGQDRVDKLVGKIVDKASIDDNLKPEDQETHKQMNDHIETYFT